MPTIAGTTVHEIEIKKSRFIAYLTHAETVTDAEAQLAGLRKEYWDARHHCSALVLGPHGDRQRSNDDGEPAGTAGMPMLEVLRHRGVTDVIAVVVRYFGGTLLGAGGLVRAYTAAVSEGLDAAPIVRRAWRQPLTFRVPMAQIGRVEHAVRSWLERNDGSMTGVEYAGEATVSVAIEPADLADFCACVDTVVGGKVEIAKEPLIVLDLPGWFGEAGR